MSAADHPNSLDVAMISRDFPRVRRGYDPTSVDHHLSLIVAQVTALQARQTSGSDESLDLVLKATRRSVDEALQDARRTADQIIADAHERASEIKAEAEARCRALDAEGRERYLEMGRLAEIRADELAELDAAVAGHREMLRAAAADLDDLASDLDDGSVTHIRSVAAMDDGALEIVLDAEPAEEH